MWVHRHERLQLADEVRVATGVEVCGDPRLEHREPALVQPRGLGPGESLVGEVREGGAPPERERLAKRVGLARGRGARTFDVQLALPDADEVAGRTRDDAVGAEHLPQGVHVHLEGTERRGRWRLAPDAVDQTVRGHRLVRVEEEEREERARPLSTERDLHPVVPPHLERPEQPELHDPSRLLKPSLGGS